MAAIVLTDEDDDVLYMTASALGNIAEKLDAGEDIPNIADLLRVASMYIAAVMAGAFERAIDAEASYN